MKSPIRRIFFTSLTLIMAGSAVFLAWKLLLAHDSVGCGNRGCNSAFGAISSFIGGFATLVICVIWDVFDLD